DPRNADVLFPYLNGEDLNSHPEQKPRRWVINFWDWPQERAQQYSEPYSIVRALVEPERRRKKPNGAYVLRNPLPQRWWQYAEKRPALYHALGRGHLFERHSEDWVEDSRSIPKIIACSRHSKYWVPCFIRNDCVPSEATAVFVPKLMGQFAYMNSALHSEWAWKQASRLETRLRYTPSDCFETFPWPAASESAERIEELGESLHDLRSSIMKRDWIGLTALYNRFHSPYESDSAIFRLRDLQVEIDCAVVNAYDLGGLDLKHDFHEVPYLPESDRIRFTISADARRGILNLLSGLNRKRYEEELPLGSRQGKTKRKGSSTQRMQEPWTASLSFPAPPQTTLFPVSPQMEFRE